MNGVFGLWISILNRSAGAYFQRELSHWGLGPGQQAYLLALSPGKGTTQEELSRQLKVDKANVSRAVKSLMALGYVERIRSTEDRRSWIVSLSESGKKARVEVEKVSQSWLETLKAAVAPLEWEQTERTLEKIAHAALNYTVDGVLKPKNDNRPTNPEYSP